MSILLKRSRLENRKFSRA